ncbi:MAG: isocitrate lyase/phosphoenolpyruvate mutase family protein [Planctomycetota bacterium]|nr:isocitrate lyase/phosphoenolpyruvate mutase family protein [Planctomycetota bacterium]
MHTHQQEHPGLRLRRAMKSACVGLPGAPSGLVARAVARAGFQGCYVSGAAVSASMGMPDVGMVSLSEFCGVIEQVARASALPVLADADTGFGESEMVMRTVSEYARAGAAGLHIEDQVFPKRCGHLDGKRLVPVDHMAEKVAAAARMRDALPAGGSSFIVCARTDARGVEGLPAVIDRARAYLDAGADMIFPEGLSSEAEFGEVAAAVKEHVAGAALLANMTEFGKTPVIPLERFGSLGYSCVIWPVTTLRAAMGEVTRTLAELKRAGSVAPFLDRLQTRAELYDLLGYTPGDEWPFPGPDPRR